jgi:hypothetical protein
MNTNDPNSMIPHHLPQIGNRRGTMGRILPGFSARVVRDGTEVSLFAEGELEVRGGPLSPDWQHTGASGSFDREGFFTLAQAQSPSPRASAQTSPSSSAQNEMTMGRQQTSQS